MSQKERDSFKIPKYVHKILNHFWNCYKLEHCIHCFDCIAFALLYAEDNQLCLPPPGKPYLIRGKNKFWNFEKFLLSTIVNDADHKYNPCPRALSYPLVRRFSKWLLRLPKEWKVCFRTGLICHAEFKHEAYEYGLIVFNTSRKKVHGEI